MEREQLYLINRPPSPRVFLAANLRALVQCGEKIERAAAASVLVGHARIGGRVVAVPGKEISNLKKNIDMQYALHNIFLRIKNSFRDARSAKSLANCAK